MACSGCRSTGGSAAAAPARVGDVRRDVGAVLEWPDTRDAKLPDALPIINQNIQWKPFLKEKTKTFLEMFYKIRLDSLEIMRMW